MKTRKRLTWGVGSLLAGVSLLLSGCTGDILADNFRTNISSFLIGVFSDAVTGAVTPR